MRLGELCAGYNGLGMAVEEVFGAEPAWFSEFDEAPSRILAHHYPNVPNYGDMTKIDWAAIERVDIISGGTPCQDLSAAGKRRGMTEGTRSNLWVQMREAIAIQRPRYVVWENVRGAYSATAASDLEQCSGCMGDATDGGSVLRALGRVLGDLSDLGFNAEWRGLRAADVGACHGRYRVFVLAYDPSRIGRDQAQQHHGRYTTADDRASVSDESDRDAVRPRPIGGTTADTEGERWGEGWPESAWIERGLSAARDSASLADASGSAVREYTGKSSTEEAGAGSRDGSSDSRGERPAGDGREVEAASDGLRCGSGGWASEPEQARGNHATLGSDPGGTNWGEYEPAIRRWERTVRRRAPRPTEPTGRDNGHRLSPRFTEWMMGLPDGWVTDPAIGISRNEQLKACGNGVVPQQAAAALRDMLGALSALQAA